MTRLKILFVLAFALALALPAGSASAASQMDFAVQQDEVFVHQIPNRSLRALPREKGFDLATRLHAGWIRANVLWGYTLGADARKRNKPGVLRYDWGPYDALVDGAAARGLRVQLALSGPAPAWATANRKFGTYKPNAREYATFVHDAATHFKGRVSRYSIWNEPNYNDWLTPLKSASRLYRDYYQRGWAVIKQVDPSAQVFIGELAANASKKGIAPLKFLRDTVCANVRYRPGARCPTLRTDGFAMHPYDLWHKPTYRFPGADNVTLGTIGRLTSALSKLQRANLLTTPSGGTPYVYVTEYGYLSATNHKVSPKTQGKYLVQAYQLAQRNPRIKQMLQYVLIKTSGAYTFFDTSIATRNGTPTAAFWALEGWVKRAIQAGKVSPPGQAR